MFVSFLIKIKVVEIDEKDNKICKFVKNRLFNKYDVVVSNLLTKDKCYILNKSYYIKICTFKNEILKKITNNLVKLQLLQEKIEFQNQKIVIEEIIFNEEKSQYVKKIPISNIFKIEKGDRIKIKFLSPTLFKFGDEYYSEPEPYLHLSKSYKCLKKYISNIEIDEMPKYILRKIKCLNKEIKKSEVFIKNKKYQCFVGSLEYDLSDIPSEYKSIVLGLLYFSYFQGVGEFTNIGMGQIDIG